MFLIFLNISLISFAASNFVGFRPISLASVLVLFVGSLQDITDQRSEGLWHYGTMGQHRRPPNGEPMTRPYTGSMNGALKRSWSVRLTPTWKNMKNDMKRKKKRSPLVHPGSQLVDTSCTPPWWKVGDGPFYGFFHQRPGGRLERHLGQAHRVLDLPQGWAFFKKIECQVDPWVSSRPILTNTDLLKQRGLKNRLSQLDNTFFQKHSG